MRFIASIELAFTAWALGHPNEDHPPDLAEALTAFVAANVRFLVIGGHAASFHARPRTTKDLDLWVASDAENIERLCAALASFGVSPEVVSAARTFADDEIVWFGRPPARIDLLRTIPGVEFEAAWPRRVVVEVGGIAVAFIGRDDLIANKRATGRPQDLRDVRAIERAARAAASTKKPPRRR